jgi:hypothetical protein
MKYLLLVSVVVMMALVTVATATPALAAGPSAPTANQLLDQLKNTQTSQEGYALWNSLTPAQQNAVRALVEPKNLKVTVTDNKALPINAIGVSSMASGGGSYTIVIQRSRWLSLDLGCDSNYLQQWSDHNISQWTFVCRKSLQIQLAV